MKLVFDTNTIISAALFFDSKPALALRIALLKFDVLTSEPINEEFKDVFSRSKFDKYVSHEERLNFLSNYLSLAKIFVVSSNINDCRDAKDNISGTRRRQRV